MNLSLDAWMKALRCLLSARKKTEWLVQALIKLMAVSTTASDASAPGWSEVSHRWQAALKEPVHPWMLLELWWHSYLTSNWGLPRNQEMAITPFRPLNPFSSRHVLWRAQPWPCSPFPECPSSKASWWDGGDLWPMAQISISPSYQPLKCVLRCPIAYPIWWEIKIKEKPNSSVHNCQCFQRQSSEVLAVQPPQPGFLSSIPGSNVRTCRNYLIYVSLSFLISKMGIKKKCGENTCGKVSTQQFYY